MEGRPKIRVVAAAVILGAAFATTGAGCAGCPTALLSGELVEQGAEPVVVVSDGVPAEKMNWPFGYDVRSEGGHPVITDLLGGVKARAGDTVRLGGGETESGTFNVCGAVEISPA